MRVMKRLKRNRVREEVWKLAQQVAALRIRRLASGRCGRKYPWAVHKAYQRLLEEEMARAHKDPVRWIGQAYLELKKEHWVVVTHVMAEEIKKEAH